MDLSPHSKKSLKGALKYLRRLRGGIPGRGKATNSPPADQRAESPQESSAISYIERLPNELLISILELVYERILIERFVDSFLTWNKLLHVCTRWRDVILSVSRLWRIAPIFYNLRPLKMCLSLHGNTPLDVIMSNPWVSLNALPLLQPHISSVRTLALYMPVMHPNMSPHSEILSVHMPCLEELRIHPGMVLDRPEIFGPPAVDIQPYPQLQRLELSDLIAPTRITSLRAIKLRRCSWPFSFPDFIYTLDRCSRLEELHLEESLFSMATSVPRVITQDSPQHATLPKLRKLDVEDDSAGLITVLMALIKAPALVSLRVLCLRVRPSMRDAQSQPSDSEDLFCPLIARPSSVLPKYPPDGGPVKASLSFMHDVCMIKVSSTTPQNPISIDLCARFDLSWTRVVPATLQDMGHLFWNTPITDLVVEGSSYHILPTVWAEVFTSLPLLEKLELTGNGTWTAMWQGLRSDATGGGPCCPRLKTVHIRHTSRPEENYPAPPDDRDLQVITEALRGREGGGAKLEELVWAVYSRHHGDYGASRERFLAKLAPLVERVTYKDLGQCIEAPLMSLPGLSLPPSSKPQG